MGDINQLRKQAQEIQKELQGERIEVNKNGVRIIITGEQKVEELEINNATNEDVKEAVNEAIKKAQEVAAGKLQGMTGGLGGLLK